MTPHSPADGELDRWDTPGTAPAAAGPNLGATRPLRILIADDAVAIRQAVERTLTRRGHQVEHAPDAFQAFRLCGERSFDVVLADAHMPGNGSMLLQRLRGLPTFRGRTILITGDTAFQPAAGTADRVIFKPFDFNAMARLVEELGSGVDA
jgi:CheY-like chemotaxis protein